MDVLANEVLVQFENRYYMISFLPSFELCLMINGLAECIILCVIL